MSDEEEETIYKGKKMDPLENGESSPFLNYKKKKKKKKKIINMKISICTGIRGEEYQITEKKCFSNDK